MSTQSMPLIFDGHNDVLFDLYAPNRKYKRSFFERSEHGHIDLPRALEGGLGGGFFAVYVPNKKARKTAKASEKVGESSNYLFPLPPALEFNYAVSYATEMVGRLYELEAGSKGKLKVVKSADEIEKALKKKTIAALLHFEGAEAIDADLHNLHAYYQAGLRSIGIVWSRPTIFAHGVPFGFPHSPDTGDGLTDAGKRLVRECNEMGVMIDLSHLNEKGFWDVAAITSKPLVATHSNAHAMCASTRNLTDKQIDAVAESGGIIGLNYHIGFLRADGLSTEQTTVDEIVRHAGYIAERIGVEHLALGSDFDGATMPQDMKDAAGLPKLMNALKSSGFDEAELRKIAHENWLRILRQTLK